MSNVVPYERLEEDKAAEILELEEELKKLETSIGSGMALIDTNFTESIVVR